MNTSLCSSTGVQIPESLPVSCITPNNHPLIMLYTDKDLPPAMDFNAGQGAGLQLFHCVKAAQFVKYKYVVCKPGTSVPFINNSEIIDFSGRYLGPLFLEFASQFYAYFLHPFFPLSKHPPEVTKTHLFWFLNKGGGRNIQQLIILLKSNLFNSFIAYIIYLLVHCGIILREKVCFFLLQHPRTTHTDQQKTQLFQENVNCVCQVCFLCLIENLQKQPVMFPKCGFSQLAGIPSTCMDKSVFRLDVLCIAGFSKQGRRLRRVVLQHPPLAPNA